MSYYVYAYLVDADKVKAVYGSHNVDLLNHLSSSLKEKLDNLNNYFRSKISPSENAYSVLADIVNGEKRSPYIAFMYGYVYEVICEYYGRIIYNAENLWQLDEQSTFIPIPLSNDFPYIISIPISELEIKKQQYTALEAGNGIGDYDYEEEMDDLNFIFDEAIEAQKDLIITVY